MIKYITEKEAIDWVSKQKNIHDIHKNFYDWKKHIITISNFWPQCKKFYKGAGYFLGYFEKELVAIYWYNKVDDEIYDGYLISKKAGAGLKLGRYLQHNVEWLINWSLCERKYLKFNERLGFEFKDSVKKDNEEWILLCRKKY